MTRRPAESVTIIFDGRCGMCTRTIEALLARDGRHRLTPVPCQSVHGVERFGLTWADCEASMWAVTPDGSTKAGAQGAMLIVAVLLQRQWPIAIGRLPIVRQVLELGYRVIARNRGRLPGVTPWCEAHPEQCVDREA